MIVTTTDGVEGRAISEYCGIASGEAVPGIYRRRQDAADEAQALGSINELFVRGGLQEEDGVVVDPAPEVWIELPEESTDLWIPGPPEVSGQLVQLRAKDCGVDHGGGRFWKDRSRKIRF